LILIQSSRKAISLERLDDNEIFLFMQANWIFQKKALMNGFLNIVEFDLISLVPFKVQCIFDLTLSRVQAITWR